MGTIALRREKGLSHGEFFSYELGISNKFELLKDFAKGGYWYAAVRNNETGEVFATVVKFSWSRGSYCNFSYKHMVESMGPYAYDAPEALLDLLSPTENKYALEWRAQCRAQVERTEALKALQVGDTVYFGSGWPEAIWESTVVDLKRGLFRGSDGVTYRPRKWRDHVRLSPAKEVA